MAVDGTSKQAAMSERTRCSRLRTITLRLFLFASSISRIMGLLVYISIQILRYSTIVYLFLRASYVIVAMTQSCTATPEESKMVNRSSSNVVL